MLHERVLDRVLYERVLDRVLYEGVLDRVLHERVLDRLLYEGVLYRVLDERGDASTRGHVLCRAAASALPRAAPARRCRRIRTACWTREAV